MTTLAACPRSFNVAFSSVSPSSSVMRVAPVRMAISLSISFFLSPNPGALTAVILSTPLSLLSTKVESASPSISSAMIRSGRPLCCTCSSIGTRSLSEVSLLSVKRMIGDSNSQVIFSVFVTK